MSDFISKIGHLDPRFYSVIYCAIPGVQMSGVQMSGVQMSGVQMSGVQMYPTLPNRAIFSKNTPWEDHEAFIFCFNNVWALQKSRLIVLP